VRPAKRLSLLRLLLMMLLCIASLLIKKVN